VVALRLLTTAAQIGPSSLGLWVLGVVLFFFPVALIVIELSARIPGEGGLYLWSKAAFGEAHGFIAGWSYWVSNLVFFPAMLLFGAGAFLHVGGERWVGWSGHAGYNATYCLAALWGATLLNIFGLHRAKWLLNIGGTATWLAGAMIAVGGAIAWFKFGPATPLSVGGLVPRFESFESFSTLASMALAYSGLELGVILGGEIREPSRTIPRAIVISGVAIAGIYITGTAALLVALPAQSIDVVSGIPQALSAVGARLGMSLFGPLVAVLIVLNNLGCLGAWVSGTARLPFVVGLDRYLPVWMAWLHPRHGTPWVALLVQGAVATGILFLALSGSTVHEAFVVLNDMTLILAFLPLLYLFGSLPVLWRRGVDAAARGVRSRSSQVGYWFLTGLGFATTLLAIVTSMVPPASVADRGVFFLKVAGGCLLLIGIGLACFFYERRQLRRTGD